MEHTRIRGLQALRAVGEFERDGMKITELVTYIFTEHIRTEFTARVASGNVDAFKAEFEQILQSAMVP